MQEMTTFRAAHGTIGNGVPLVREGSLRVRHNGRGVKNWPVVDQIDKPRASLCGARDKLACASSSAKTQRFAVGNAHVDLRVDNQVDPASLVAPRPRRRRRI